MALKLYLTSVASGGEGTFLAGRLPAKCYSLTISCFEWWIFLDGLALVGAGGVSRLNGDPS
jgi:hypothetical protein